MLIKKGVIIDKIENNELCGRYKNLYLKIRSFYLISKQILFTSYIKKFLLELEKNPREILGFIVCNRYYTNEIVEKYGNDNERLFLCHENDLFNNIKMIEKRKKIIFENEYIKLSKIVRKQEEIILSLREELKNKNKQTLFEN
jgi:hypothetical protein